MASEEVTIETGTTVLCFLCTLKVYEPVPYSSDGIERTFCCHGCRNVWQILEESGRLEGHADPRESSLYLQALASGLIGGNRPPEQLPPAPATVAISRERKGSGLDDSRQCVLQIDGMWCSSCAWLIEQTLRRSRGVVSADVSFASDTARVVYKPAKTDEITLTKSVSNLGYATAPLGESNDNDPRVITRRKELWRVVIALSFAMNVMMMQFVLYTGYFEGIAPSIRRGLPWLLLILSVPVLVAGQTIFLRAFRAAQQKTATMESLVALGSGAAFCYSVWQTVRGTGHVYYDTADMLVALVMVGKFIESGVRQRASDSLSLLYGLLPRKAKVLIEGREVSVAVTKIAVGDLLIVRAGDRIAADGKLLSGSGTVDESLLSGESRPINKTVGDDVVGGTLLQSGVLRVRVERDSSSGALNQIITMVQESLGRKTPSERIADQISRYFVPSVLALSLATGAVLILADHTSPDIAITRMVAILVIACPCALGIATPMALASGVALAAQSGILVADGGAIETMSRVKTLILDKTGTVTEGSFQVLHLAGEFDKLRLLAALERCSGHPIATAIKAYCPAVLPGEVADNFKEQPGVGISGVVDGQSMFAGNERSVGNAGLELTGELAAFGILHASSGLTVIYWGIESEVVLGALALGDTIRANAREAVATLTGLGIGLGLISGDSKSATGSVARSLNINVWRGGVLPAEKAHWVESAINVFKGSGAKVCMVGDGVNDAPALAAADVGIALASGTDLAARTAQVTLLAPDINLIPKLIDVSRRTISTVRQNLVWAFAYNAVCIPLAVLGKITPIWAVCAMLLSSLTVICNTQRLRR